VFAIKGDSAEGKPIKGKASVVDVNHKGRVIKRGLKLWWVGTDTAKDLIFSRLTLKDPGPGYVHFSQALNSGYFEGLTSEVRRQVRTTTGVKHRWMKVRDRNEPLDTFVYALFASQALDHHKLTERQWERLEQALLPDLFEPSGTFVEPVKSGSRVVVDVVATEVVDQPKVAAPVPAAPPAANQPAAPRPNRLATPEARVNLFDLMYGN
jgi:phage terminase large subunit GpA-like protein